MFINASNTIGILIGQATTTTFGDMFTTLMFVLIMLFAVCLLFGIKIEYVSILLLPLVLAYASYYSEFYATLTVIIIYLGIVITKNWIFK